MKKISTIQFVLFFRIGDHRNSSLRKIFQNSNRYGDDSTIEVRKFFYITSFTSWRIHP
ncbi:uncharacterized protein MYCFIDRAFT_171449 [Pseudocercospora fijiensis CIRAD86]|uniref:Uncharacterized protein n=1 Tax=Pseudocercospora fijiensis (strain CIRAD86) TaxID=383855 RepID=M3A353_PSEFD|nr:uncharacterized protein MYCFIDRAFT_171449 [Pseudocercospora fijiensis CIRAD86]EME85534.1 hypothetical protein MYCFIDRAFT_171449 [Pseudocercospora fijiensis CIRAD86]